MSHTTPVTSRLRRFRQMQLGGLLLRYALRVTACGLLLLCIYALMDAAWALPADSRRTLNVIFPLSLLLGACAGLQRPGSLRQLAATLDRRRGDRRKTFSCAIDLEKLEDLSPLHAQLRKSALREAEEELGKVPAGMLIPFQALIRVGLFALLAVGLTLGLRMRFPEASEIVWSRIRNPSADISPWTRLVFHLEPADPSVVYGEDLQVSLEVEGEMPEQPVVLRTRIDGEIHETPSYREKGQRYSQRLEQVTRPVEFSFRIGRLETEWRQVDLQLLPKIVNSAITVIPPEYSGRPTRKSAFGAKSLKGLPGTRMELSLESNRPLSGGELRMKREGFPDRMIVVEAEGNRVNFSWELEETATLEIQIRDLLGNQMAAPLKSFQQLTPDQPPVVQIDSPPPFLLATPSSIIELQGSATDDVSVSGLTLIRGMPGYIDRPRPLSGGLPSQRWDFEESLQLAALGVSPGETLEFYLEAEDHRPEGGRIGVSPLTRIQIISEQEYADKLRQAEQLEGFQERFYLAGEAMDAAMKALQALQQEIESESPTRESLQQAIDRAAKASRNAEEVFRQQQEDFPIFDLEKRAQNKLRDLKNHFGKQAQALEELSPDDMALDLKVAQLAGAMKQKEAEIAMDRDMEERFIKIGRVIEQTVEYQELVRRQELLVRWFERYAYALPEESRDMMRDLELYQLDLQSDLAAWIEETRKRAADLGAEDQQLQREVAEMLLILEHNQVESLMRETAAAARNEQNREALRLAKAALEAMRNLDPEKEQGSGQNNFCEMCMGGGECKDPNGDSGLSDSLQQLLNALRNRGRGNGRSTGGSGGGISGNMNDGYLTRGSSPLNLPMQGPQRRRGANNGEQISGNGSGSGRGRGVDNPAVSQGHGASSSDQRIEPVELMLERSPPQYRSAIRQFFDFNQENSP